MITQTLATLATLAIIFVASLIAGIATMIAIGYLVNPLRTGKFNAKNLRFAGGFYLDFAAYLIPVLA